VEVLLVNNDVLLVLGLLLNFNGHGEASLDVHNLTVKGAQEGADDRLLVFGATQEVVQNVGYNYGVDQALQVFNTEAEVEVGQVGSGLNLLELSGNHVLCCLLCLRL
jgi:hypothetical protein